MIERSEDRILLHAPETRHAVETARGHETVRSCIEPEFSEQRAMVPEPHESWAAAAHAGDAHPVNAFAPGVLLEAQCVRQVDKSAQWIRRVDQPHASCYQSGYELTVRLVSRAFRADPEEGRYNRGHEKTRGECHGGERRRAMPPPELQHSRSYGGRPGRQRLVLQMPPHIGGQLRR